MEYCTLWIKCREPKWWNMLKYRSQSKFKRYSIINPSEFVIRLLKNVCFAFIIFVPLLCDLSVLSKCAIMNRKYIFFTFILLYDVQLQYKPFFRGEIVLSSIKYCCNRRKCEPLLFLQLKVKTSVNILRNYFSIFILI